MSTLNTIRAILARAAIATVKVADERSKIAEKSKGAYSLFVEAGIVAGNSESLSAAADAMFDEIRSTGSVKDEKGKARTVATDKNKEGTQYLVPSAIMSAKSVVLGAFEYKLDLGTIESPVTFSGLRKQVQACREAAKNANLTGVEKQRKEVLEALATLTDRAKKAEHAELSAIADALVAAFMSAQIAGEVTQEAQAA